MVAYTYLKSFEKVIAKLGHDWFRDWALDSGGFHAHRHGKTVDLLAFIDTCHRLRESAYPPQEIFGLDVIGDWKASEANYAEMTRAKVPFIPTYHVGSPEGVLVDMAQAYPKIALGGMVRYHRKREWFRECFARIWPCRVHGLGVGSLHDCTDVPWESVDAATWQHPWLMGKWRVYGNNHFAVDGQGRGYRRVSVRVEVERCLAIEAQARARWGESLAALSGADTFRYRLVCLGGFDEPCNISGEEHDIEAATNS